jgi:dTDP-4-dehydrorhamnose reductase
VKVLVLGGDGMLGHRLVRLLAPRHEVWATLHGPLATYTADGLFDARNSVPGVDVTDFARLAALVAEIAPAAVVNCVGIVKQRHEAREPITSILVNALLPHRLHEICAANGARLVQISTDCVFSGRRGGYRETDLPDPVDLYGRTKLLGEVEEAPAVTIRSSMIGLELRRRTGLVEWFLAQHGQVRGFTRAIYSGLTTAEMARLIERLLTAHPDLHGTWHVAAEPIDKHALLTRLAALLGRRDVEVVPDDGFACDRSLDGSAFAAATGYRAPSWDAMLGELAAEIASRASAGP